MKYLITILLVLTLGCLASDKDQTHDLENQRETINLETQRKNVAILIFDNVQIIDFTGPYEVFGQAGYNVFTVANKEDTITTHMKLDVLPTYDLTNCPKVDIMVVPGGGAPHHLPEDDHHSMD